MTCLEAQSNIMAFIDKKLPNDSASDFVRHMRYCKNCREELEIYYTLLVGMRELDAGGELSRDFKKDLEAELSRVDHRTTQAKRFKVSAFGIVFAICCVALLVFYDQTLLRVYNSEQRMKKEQQSVTYFYDYYSSYIELAGRDIIDETKQRLREEQEETAVELTVYQRIHQYNLSHPKKQRPKLEEEPKEDEGEIL